MKRLISAAAVAVGALAAQVAPAGAAWEYCDWDPPVTITTPSGNVSVLYVDVRTQSLVQPGEGMASATTQRAYSDTGAPVTKVSIQVWVPAIGAATATSDLVSTGPNGTGAVYAIVPGVTGQTATITFTLNTP